MAVRRIIIYHQNRYARELGHTERFRRQFGFSLPDLNCEVKSRSFSGFTLDPNLSAHQSHELSRDRQTQPGAAVFARGGRIGLRERAENLMLFVRRDSDPGIPDADAQDCSLDAWRPHLHADFYFPSLGEFDRVTDQIHNDLTKPGGVSDDGIRDIGSHVKNELQAFLLRLHRKCLDDFTQTLPQIEAQMIQFHLARFDLGKIQNVVEQRQERIRRPLDHVQVFVLVRDSVRCPAQDRSSQ